MLSVGVLKQASVSLKQADKSGAWKYQATLQVECSAGEVAALLDIVGNTITLHVFVEGEGHQTTLDEAMGEHAEGTPA